jgi:thiol-disulfide isomerase/thioredoxin
MRTILALLLCAASALAADPRPAPAFAMQRVNAAPIQIQSYRGKILVVVLISTGCPHCQEYIANLGPISKEYASKGVEVLACATDEEAAKKVPDFIKQYQPPFPVGYADPEPVNRLVGRSVMDTRSFYVPHVTIIDRGGLIRGDYFGDSPFVQNNGPANLRAELDKLLAAPAPRPAAAKKAPKK